jgi:hypothetical protein
MHTHLAKVVAEAGLEEGAGLRVGGWERGEEAIIYLKAKDILSRPRLISEGIPKRAGDAGDGVFFCIF